MNERVRLRDEEELSHEMELSKLLGELRQLKNESKDLKVELAKQKRIREERERLLKEQKHTIDVLTCIVVEVGGSFV